MLCSFISVCFLFSGMNNLTVHFGENYLQVDKTLGFYSIQPSSTLGLDYWKVVTESASMLIYAIFIVMMFSELRCLEVLNVFLYA